MQVPKSANASVPPSILGSSVILGAREVALVVYVDVPRTDGWETLLERVGSSRPKKWSLLQITQ